MFKKFIAVEFSINWLRWLIYSGFLLIVAYIAFPKLHDPLVYVAAVLAGIGVLISALNEIEARYAEIKHATVECSLEFVHDWNHPTFYHAKSNGREVIRHFREKGVGDHEYVTTRQQNLMDILNFFESMSIAIQCGHADDATAKRFFRGIVIECWQVAEPWIKARRAEKHNPRLLCELEKLAHDWGNS